MKEVIAGIVVLVSLVLIPGSAFAYWVQDSYGQGIGGSVLVGLDTLFAGVFVPLLSLFVVITHHHSYAVCLYSSTIFTLASVIPNLAWSYVHES